ncbi:gamma-glutamyltranspeptidase [Backusella circina FSU 941]|nr:gamma-glutamyltranspeptidase [Backusella circina FSU 941]
MAAPYLPFDSRRSTVYATNGIVSSFQPLATQVGIDILKKGGNAADAAVATAVTMGLLDPVSNNIGGNAICLFYDAKERKVKCIDGSGRTSADLTLEHVLKDPKVQQKNSILGTIHAVTIPGAACAYVDTIERFGSGKMNLSSVLEPAINMAENGYPVSQVSSYIWSVVAQDLKKVGYEKNHDWLIDDCRGPEEGEIMKMPSLARTLKKLATEGKDGFYKGEIAEAFVKTLQDHGAIMTMEDLANHKSDFSDPISADYHDLTVWEPRPPSQGITTLMALGIIEALEEHHGVDFSKIEHNSAEYIHIVGEALRIAFADTKHYATDPETNPYPVELMLNKEYLRERAKLVNLERKNDDIQKGYPDCIGNTTSISVIDKDGNACSIMPSLGMGVSFNPSVSGTGILLQDRGAYFSLDKDHPNCIGPNKKPHHTLMPSLFTRKSAIGHELVAAFSIVGLFMQAQGSVQAILNMRYYNSNPQRIADMPRFSIVSSNKTQFDFNNVKNVSDCAILLEEGIPEEVCEELKSRGHTCKYGTNRLLYTFGMLNFVTSKIDSRTGKRVLAAGCDGRTDGQATGY